MKSTRIGQFFLFLGLASAHFSCALFSGGGDAPAKSSATKYISPKKPFLETPLHGGADHAWQSDLTGNTIAYNSACSKDEDSSLEILKRKILTGIDRPNLEKNDTVDFDGREGKRVAGSGFVDGVPVKFSILVFRKGDCAYDLIYVGRTSVFDSELPHFEEFLKGFRAP